MNSSTISEWIVPFHPTPTLAKECAYPCQPGNHPGDPAPPSPAAGRRARGDPMGRHPVERAADRQVRGQPEQFPEVPRHQGLAYPLLELVASQPALDERLLQEPDGAVPVGYRGRHAKLASRHGPPPAWASPALPRGRISSSLNRGYAATTHQSRRLLMGIVSRLRSTGLTDSESGGNYPHFVNRLGPVTRDDSKRQAASGACITGGGRRRAVMVKAFRFVKSFRRMRLTSLHESKSIRNAGPASLTGTPGSGCRAVRDIAVAMSVGSAGGEPFLARPAGTQMPVMAPGMLGDAGRRLSGG